MKVRNRKKMLEYCLDDVLEMKYSKNRKVLRTVKNQLLDRPIGDTTLHLSPSFILEDALVVIQDGNPKQIKQLYLLDGHRKSFRVFGVNRF